MTKDVNLFEVLEQAIRYAKGFVNQNLDVRIEITSSGLLITTRNVWVSPGLHYKTDKYIICWENLKSSYYPLNLIIDSIGISVARFKREG